MADYRKFDTFDGSIPSWLSTDTNGSGSVSTSGGALVIDTGGSGSTDAAMAVVNTALDMTKVWHIFMCVEPAGDNIGANSPFVLSLIDSSSEPVLTTQATRDTNKRVWFENQRSATLSSSRVTYKFKNSSSTEYFWNSGTDAWGTPFTMTHTYWANGDSYIFGFVLDGPNDRMRMLGYHKQQAPGALALIVDTDWVDFGVASTEIDPIDNDLWVVLGNPEKDTAAYDDTLSIKWLMVSDDSAGDDSWYYANVATIISHPRDYLIRAYRAMMAIDGFPFLVSIEPINSNDLTTSDVVVPGDFSGTRLWVKDPSVCGPVSGKYYMVVNVWNDADSLCDIWIGESTDLVAWTGWTEIFSASTGTSKYEFPFLWYDGDATRWHIVLSRETTGTEWEGYYSYTDSATPYTSWAALSKKVEKSAGAGWQDDGAGQPTMIYYGSFVWYFSGVSNGTGDYIWGAHYATSPTVDGTYTVNTDDAPQFERSQVATQVNAGTLTGYTLTVDSATGFSAGDLVYIDDDPTNVIESIDSSTVMTLRYWFSVANNDAVRLINYNSVAINLLKEKQGGGWIGSLTPFKFPLGGNDRDEKLIFMRTDDANPLTATWSLCNEPPSDTAYSVYETLTSAENAGGITLNIETVSLPFSLGLSKIHPSRNVLLRL